MAAQLRTAANSSLLAPFLSSPSVTSTPSRFARAYVQNVLRFSTPFVPALGWSIPSSMQLSLPVLPSLPSILEGIWESILRAVPKKKTSHAKKRHRQMAGKALKDVNSLCKCPACGSLKRMHHLCPYCMKGGLPLVSTHVHGTILIPSRPHGFNEKAGNPE